MEEFAASNRQNIVQLKTNLQNIKKGSDNIETYLDRIKAARDALVTVGVFLDDEDIVVTVLRGLPSEFAAIKTVIRAQFVNSTLPELKSLLQAAEIDIELEAQETPVPLTAMIAKTSSPTAPVAQASASTTSVPHVPQVFLRLLPCNLVLNHLCLMSRLNLHMFLCQLCPMALVLSIHMLYSILCKWEQ